MRSEKGLVEEEAGPGSGFGLTVGSNHFCSPSPVSSCVRSLGCAVSTSSPRQCSSVLNTGFPWTFPDCAGDRSCCGLQSR